MFTRIINKMLGELREESILAYMDDLLVPSKTVHEGLELLEKVLTLVKNGKLKLNLVKCSFLKEELEYLGHTVGRGGVRPGVKRRKQL